jgi:hypothetical protein
VSAPARFWRRFSFEEGESADVLDGAQSLILEAGEQIVAEASYSDTVDYWLAGIEETFPS